MSITVDYKTVGDLVPGDQLFGAHFETPDMTVADTKKVDNPAVDRQMVRIYFEPNEGEEEGGWAEMPEDQHVCVVVP